MWGVETAWVLSWLPDRVPDRDAHTPGVDIMTGILKNTDMELQAATFLLRTFEKSDVPSIARHANNYNVWRNVSDRMPYPYEEHHAEAFIGLCREMPNPPCTFAICVDGEAAGCIGFEPRDDIHRRTARVGYWLGEPYWGRGIATEALRLVTAYAFDHFDLLRLEAGVFDYNPASARVLEKVGYTFEGRLRKNCLKEGRVIDELIYARVR